MSDEYLVEINVNTEDDDFPDVDYYYNPDDVEHLVNLHVDPLQDDFHDDKIVKHKSKRRIDLIKKSKRLLSFIIKKNFKRHSKEPCRCNAQRCLGKGWRRSYENGPSCRFRKIRRYSSRVKCGNSIRVVKVKNSSLEAVPRQYCNVPCSCNNAHCLGNDWSEKHGKGKTWSFGTRYYYKK